MSTRAVPPDQPSADSFGAPKRNWGVIKDPSLVITADDWNALVATVTSLAFSGARCWVSVSAGGAMLMGGMPWGSMTSGPLAPACVRTGTGLYTITWPSLVPDLLDGTLRSFAPRASQAGANTSARTANSRQAGQVTTVETYNTAGAAADAAFTVDVY